MEGETRPCKYTAVLFAAELVTYKAYLLTLCRPTSWRIFGYGSEVGASNSKFNIELTKLIHGILTFSPAPDSMAVGVLVT